MHFLRKILALFVIIGLIQPSARAGYMDFLEAERAFRAAPHDPAVVNQMLDLAVSQHNLLTTGYLQYFAQAGLMNDLQIRAWSELPQSQDPYNDKRLLKDQFEVSKILMNLEKDPQEVPKGLKIPERKLFAKVKALLTSSQNTAENTVTGQAYFLLYQLATQATMGERTNPFQQEAQTYIERAGKMPSRFLVEAIRLGALEALPFWDSNNVFRELTTLSSEVPAGFYQAHAISGWMKAPGHLNSPTTYRDFLASNNPQSSLDLLISGALLGDNVLQTQVYGHYKASILLTQNDLKALEGRRGPKETKQRGLATEKLTQEQKELDFWAAMGMSSGNYKVLLESGCELFEQGGEKRTRSRSYFEHIVQHAPDSKEAAFAHVKLAILDAAEDREDLDEKALQHLARAQTLFDESAAISPTQEAAASLDQAAVQHSPRPQMLFDESAAISPTQEATASLDQATVQHSPRPNAFIAAAGKVKLHAQIEGAFLEDDIRIRQKNNTDSPASNWARIHKTYGDDAFLRSGHLPQLILFLLARGLKTSSEDSFRQAIDLLRTYNLPENPDRLTRALITQTVTCLVGHNHPFRTLVDANLDVIESLIQYSVQKEPTSALNHLHAVQHYTYIPAKKRQYHNHLHHYLTLASGLDLDALWNMPSNDFKAHIEARKASLNAKDLKDFPAMLNKLGVEYFHRRVAGISPEKADQRAVAIFKKAAKLENYFGMRNLSNLYSMGRGGLEESLENAIRCLEVARLHAPTDPDILTLLAENYEQLLIEAETEEERAPLRIKSLKTWEEADATGRVPLAPAHILMLHFTGMQEEDRAEHGDAIPEIQRQKYEDLMTQLAETLEHVWTTADIENQKTAVENAYILQLQYYGGTPPRDVEAWENRLQSAKDRLETTTSFNLESALEERASYQKSRKKVSKDSAQEVIPEDVTPETMDAMSMNSDTPDSPLANIETEDAGPFLSHASSSTSKSEAESTKHLPVPLTPKLIKKFRALFNGRMSHEQIIRLIRDFDATQGTNMERFYRMSHPVHAGRGRRDTQGQKRNRCTSAMDLFEKYGNITQEYIDGLTN